jgi:riboflavin biosynthesis pyrimidine reductase
MVAWEHPETFAGRSPVMLEFARFWQAADKVVYSTTLEKVSSERTRMERSFDSGKVRRMKEEAERDMLVGGPNLAAHAIRAGLVDEYHLFLAPMVVGGGTRALPDGVRFPLELQDERRFGNGMVYLRYRAEPEP